MAAVTRTIPAATLKRRRRYFNSIRKQLRRRLRIALGGELRCEVCGGVHEDFILHHIVPLAMGGPNTINNMMVLCHGCHVELHRQMAEEYQKMIEE